MSKKLIDYIRTEAIELLPLHVVLAQEALEPGTAIRSATSDTHKAEGYLCDSFYKPISRCVGE
jgi:hypothetical protein